MATTADLLAEAKAALHKLLTGQAVASFRDSNGELVTYTAANRGALSSYIAELERQLGIGCPTGPMSVWF